MKKEVAVFTVFKNENRFLPIWTDYYRKHIPSSDIYVLDHDSSDLTSLFAANTVNRVPVHRSFSFDHEWLLNVVKDFQRFLFNSYKWVIFAEADEIIVPDPDVYPGGLLDYIGTKLDNSNKLFRCSGYEVVQGKDEPPVNWNCRPVMKTRRFWSSSNLYSKFLISDRPVFWTLGFHDFSAISNGHKTTETYCNISTVPKDPELVLLHLHRLDFDYCLEKHKTNAGLDWNKKDIDFDRGLQNRICSGQDLMTWFYNPEKVRSFFDPIVLVDIPEKWRNVV